MDYSTCRQLSILPGAIALLLTTSHAVTAATFTSTRIINSTTPIPGQTDSFDHFYAPSLSGSNLAFIGETLEGNRHVPTGVYSVVEGTVGVVTDWNTPIPGRSLHFTDFLYPHTPVPGGNGPFGQMNFPSISGNNVRPSMAAGLYTHWNGSLAKILTPEDILDEKTVTGVGTRGGLSPQAWSEHGIAFSVDFSDGTSGIYVAKAMEEAEEVPEPGLWLGLLILGGWGAWRHKTRLA